ncbi:MAG TPA: electron transfer flavoprotein subunit beta/FixA family protein [Anaerovoracaceae bacterium]|nr:electron transfer flavoprotein subunit beta/FixA family protein [Anaerovoracaceae bacterium]
MNIVVCVKPVPDPEKYNLLRIDDKTKSLVREGVPTIVNPADKNALELALKLKALHGGKVAVVSMCPLFSQDRIKVCLAMGADEGYIVSDRAFGGADTFSTSYTLAKGIEKLEFKADLILTGQESADGATSQVSSQLGEWLELPHLANITEIETDGKQARMKKKTPDGFIEYEVELPAVAAVARGSNKPRMMTAAGIVKIRNKPLQVFTKADLDVDDSLIGLSGSQTKAGSLIAPEMNRESKPIEGNITQVAQQILDIIKKTGIAV